MKSILTLILCIFILVSCQDNDVTSNADVSGKWFITNVITQIPNQDNQELGISGTLILDSSMTFTASLVYNNILQSAEGTFSLIEVEDQRYVVLESEEMLFQTCDNVQWLLIKDNDQLVGGGAACDRLGYVFERKE